CSLTTRHDDRAPREKNRREPSGLFPIRTRLPPTAKDRWVLLVHVVRWQWPEGGPEPACPCQRPSRVARRTTGPPPCRSRASKRSTSRYRRSSDANRY